jgi:hypothetical protein
VHPAAVGTGKLATEGVEGKFFTPNGGFGPRIISDCVTYGRMTYFASTPLINAENTLALPSAPPAASNTPFGCQSMDKTVDLSGFFKCLDVHQLFSSSNEQTATDLAPLPTANLSSLGLHLTHVAARLIRRRTRTGFHSPVVSLRVQT